MLTYAHSHPALVPLLLAIFPSVSPRALAHPGLRDLVINVGPTTHISSQDQQVHLKFILSH